MIMAVVSIPTISLAQEAQAPATDPQSKRQNESAVVNSVPPSPSPPADTMKQPAPPIAETAPEGATPKAETGKKSPLQSSN